MCVCMSVFACVYCSLIHTWRVTKRGVNFSQPITSKQHITVIMKKHLWGDRSERKKMFFKIRIIMSRAVNLRKNFMREYFYVNLLRKRFNFVSFRVNILTPRRLYRSHGTHKYSRRARAEIAPWLYVIKSAADAITRVFVSRNVR